MSTVRHPVRTDSSASVKAASGGVSERSLEAAQDLASSAARRTDIPIRVGFVERINADAPPESRDAAAPLAQLVASGGRGGAVAIKLFLAIVWRCSAAPFTTDISARTWAKLLDLPDPAHRGARRVTDALRTLERHHLIQLERRHGEPSIIHLLDEHGLGAPYTLPSTASVNAPAAEKDQHLYFKIPTALWTNGQIQPMSAPALAMLLVCLASERGQYGKSQWWSTEGFPNRYGLSPATRSRGTRELVERRLLIVNKELISNAGSSGFGREKVRNRYSLVNETLGRKSPATPGTPPPPPRPSSR